MTCMHFGDMRCHLDVVTLLKMAEVSARDANFYLPFVVSVFCASFANVDRLFHWPGACNTLGTT